MIKTIKKINSTNFNFSYRMSLCLIQITLIFLYFLIIAGCSTVSKTTYTNSYKSCLADKELYQARSAELQSIVKSDQEDRINFEMKTSEELQGMASRDVVRRKRVGEIFGEGCLQSAADFSAAALIYQHGDVSDHFMQSFLWSKRAVVLGDAKQKDLKALGIDRYLVNTGHKQLFGSQATKTDLSAKGCWCLHMIEPSFPENLRFEFSKRTKKDFINWVSSMNQGQECKKLECEVELKPTPKGTILGFW